MPSVPRLLVITDRLSAERAGRDVPDAVSAALQGGAPAILLRDKDLSREWRRELGERVAPLVEAAGALLLVSSDVELAHHLDAGGVHLAAADPPVAPDAGRRRYSTHGASVRACGRGASEGRLLVGRSCHDATEVAAAASEQLDYVSVSPVAPTASKPGHGPALGATGLRELASIAGALPLLALGGVTSDDVGRWRRAGAHGVAVMGTVMGAHDPAEVVRGLLAAMDTPPTDHAAADSGRPRAAADAATTTRERP